MFGVVNVDYLLKPGDTVTKGATREIEAESQITFSDFGARFDDVKAPAETEVVDLEKLKSK